MKKEKAALVVVLMSACAAPAAANQCAEIRAHIAQLDQYIANDSIADSRNLRIRDRNNWVQAYNSMCTGGAGGGGAAAGSGASRNAAMIGLGIGALGLLRDMVRQHEAQQAEAELNAQLQQRMLEEQAAMQREAEERERRRQEAAARAADDARRQSLQNPFASSISGPSSSNPFSGSGHAGAGNTANPFAGQAAASDNPFSNPAPGASRPVQLARTDANPVPSRGFRSDAEIAALCKSAPNPGACQLAEYTARDKLAAYRQWRADAAAARDRRLLDAETDIERAIAEYRRQRAQEGPRPSNATVPGENFARSPVIDRRGDGYDHCREGAARPDTVVACYDQPLASPPRGRTDAQGQAQTQGSERERLRREVLARRAEREANREAAAHDRRPTWTVEGRGEPQSAPDAPAEPQAQPPLRREYLTETQCRNLHGRWIAESFNQYVCEFDPRNLESTEGIGREASEEVERFRREMGHIDGEQNR